MTGRTIKQRIYRGWKIEQKTSCKYRFTITKGSKVIRTNEPKNIIEAMDFVDNMLDQIIKYNKENKEVKKRKNIIF